jgi:hypothetical protein
MWYGYDSDDEEAIAMAWDAMGEGKSLVDVSGPIESRMVKYFQDKTGVVKQAVEAATKAAGAEDYIVLDWGEAMTMATMAEILGGAVAGTTH